MVYELDDCQRLSVAFYARVAQDPVLRPIFPSSFHCAIPALARFLAQFLGGACVYSEQRWFLSLREAHRRFRMTRQARDAWMRNMRAAMAAVGAPEELDSFFEAASLYLIGQPAGRLEGPLGPAWERFVALEEAVAAARAGRAPAADPRLEECFAHDPTARAELTGLMIGIPALHDTVRRELDARPELARVRYGYSRTLLHEAASVGCAPMVELLLRLGADPNGLGGRTPLYVVGNSCLPGTGGEVVRLLVAAGADVNAPVGVKRCTPLHMAARRGNLQVAQALIECGADLEARDSHGDTPLRRAMNCRKFEVAELLRFRRAAGGGAV